MLKEQLQIDLRESLKTQDAKKISVLRMLSAALHNKVIEKRGKGLEGELNDDEALEILMKEAKKRKEAAEIYSKGGRSDLAEKENEEYEIIKRYLPEQISEEELKRIAGAVLERLGVKDIKEMGKAIGEVMKEVKGKAEPRLVSEMVKKILSKVN